LKYVALSFHQSYIMSKASPLHHSSGPKALRTQSTVMPTITNKRKRWSVGYL